MKEISFFSSFFKNKFKKLFIFGRAGILLLPGLCQVVGSGGHSPAVVPGLLTAEASLVSKHRL